MRESNRGRGSAGRTGTLHRVPDALGQLTRGQLPLRLSLCIPALSGLYHPSLAPSEAQRGSGEWLPE